MVFRHYMCGVIIQLREVLWVCMCGFFIKGVVLYNEDSTTESKCRRRCCHPPLLVSIINCFTHFCFPFRFVKAWWVSLQLEGGFLFNIVTIQASRCEWWRKLQPWRRHILQRKRMRGGMLDYYSILWHLWKKCGKGDQQNTWKELFTFC